MDLFSLLEPCKIISTVGTCKNAGKTTVLNFLVSGYHHSFHLGITSIGYDGEEKDAITRLEKPRVLVFPGMYVTTATDCLQKTEVPFKFVHDTGLKTVIGDIHIVKILGKGMIEISGPSVISQMKQVCDKMGELGCEKVIVDGAAGRLSFATISDGMVLSIGAAMAASMEKVIKEGAYLVKLLTLAPEADVVNIERPTNTVVRKEVHGDTNYFIYRGVIGDKDIKLLMKEHRHLNCVRVVVQNVAAVFVTSKVYERFVHKGGRILVQGAMPLRAITINPMNPYGDWFDEKEFLKKMSENVPLPVFDIMNEKVKVNEK